MTIITSKASQMQASLWILLLLAYSVAATEKKVVCYWASWSIYKEGNGNFEVPDIDPSLCSHLIYAFVGIEPDGTIEVLDEHADLPANGGKDGYNLFNRLREKNPSLKTLASVGGWSQGSVSFSRVVTDPALRRRFVRNAVDFVKRYGFNGLDVDWEHPGERGGAPTDKDNLVLLLKELREEFDKEGLLLGAAVVAIPTMAKDCYDIPNMSKYLHFINLMAYDIHMGSAMVTGSNAPLYAGSWETGVDATLNVNASVRYWLSQGAPAEKLILGAPLYGHSFTLADPSNTKIGAPSSGPGNPGPYSGEAGSLGYNEICEKQKTESWSIKFSEQQRVPYAFKGNQWISYDNVESLKEKAEYVNDLGLGGVMVWTIDTDDFRGICGKKYPLLGALKQALR